MQTSDSTKNIMPILQSLQATVGTVPKSGVNEHHKYSYAKLEDFITALGTYLTDLNLVITTTIDSHQLVSLKDNFISASIMLRTRVTHVVSGEWVEVTCPGEGIDSGDKSTYKAITGARKYALAIMFNLVTGDDPESDSSHESDGPYHAPVVTKTFRPSVQTATAPAGTTMSGTGVSGVLTDHNHVLNNMGLNARIQKSPDGKYTNFIVSSLSGGKLTSVLPEAILNVHVRGKDDPYDKNRGMWIPGGEASFGDLAFTHFMNTIKKRYGAPSSPAQMTPPGEVSEDDFPF